MRKGLLIVAVGLLVALPAAAGDIVEVQKTPTMGEPNADQALVYFVRPAFVGKAVKFWALADDQVLGATKGKTFVWGLVAPGRHVFWSKAENISALQMEVEAGKTYYLKQGARMGGLKARVKLEPLSEADGKAALEKCKYATLTAEGKERGKEVVADGLAKAKARAANGAMEEEGESSEPEGG